jgi:hypothetical protein
MDNQVYQYAQEMMRFHRVNEIGDGTLKAKRKRLMKRLLRAARRYLSQDDSQQVSTQKSGMIGKVALFAKRTIRNTIYWVMRVLIRVKAMLKKR